MFTCEGSFPIFNVMIMLEQFPSFSSRSACRENPMDGALYHQQIFVAVCSDQHLIFAILSTSNVTRSLSMVVITIGDIHICNSGPIFKISITTS